MNDRPAWEQRARRAGLELPFDPKAIARFHAAIDSGAAARALTTRAEDAPRGDPRWAEVRRLEDLLPAIRRASDRAEEALEKARVRLDRTPRGDLEPQRAKVRALEETAAESASAIDRLMSSIDAARTAAALPMLTGLAFPPPPVASAILSREEQEIEEDAAIVRAADLLVEQVKGQRGPEATEIRRRRKEAAAVAKRRRAGRKLRPELRAAIAAIASLPLEQVIAKWPAAAGLRPVPIATIPCCPRTGCRSAAASARAAKAADRLDRAQAEAIRLEAAAREAERRTAERRDALQRRQAGLAASTPPTAAGIRRRDTEIARIERAIADLDTCHPRRRKAKGGGPVVLSSWPPLVTPAGEVPVIATVISADRLVTSHLPRSWAIDPRYPAQTQERRYDRDPVEQTKVTRIARDLNPALLLTRTPSALDGPPVVIAEGGDFIALGGNGRGMALRIAYADGRADAYEGALRQLVRRPLPPRPVLVRVLRPEAAEPGSWARWSRDLNRPLGAGLDLTAQGVSLARSLPSRVIELLAGRDLSTALRGAPGREAIRELQIAGLVGQGERGLFEDEGLSEAGRQLVRRALAGAVLQDADLVDALPPAVVDQVARAGPSLLEAGNIAGPGYDLRRAVQAAARDYADARSWRAGIDSWIASPHLVAPAVLGEALGPPAIRALVAGRLPELAAAWLDHAKANPEGQAVMFRDERTPPEVLASLEERLR